jgi:hypothetical protein
MRMQRVKEKERIVVYFRDRGKLRRTTIVLPEFFQRLHDREKLFQIVHGENVPREHRIRGLIRKIVRKVLNG